MMEWLSLIEFWHWLIVAVVLIILEMLFIGSYFLLMMGIAAGIVGCILFFIPDLSWLMQVMTFTILSIVTILFFRQYQKNNPVVRAEPSLNRRGEQYIGRVFTLDEAIVNGVGKVKVDDSTWKVSGHDLPAGTKIRIVSVDGTTFKVETVS